MSPCLTPRPWANHGGCSSSDTSWSDTSGIWKRSGRLSLSSSDQIISDGCFAEHAVSPFGELLLGRDVDFVLHAADLHNVSQVPRLPVHLDPLFEEDLLLGRAEWCTREENPSQAGAREGNPSPKAELTFGNHAEHQTLQLCTGLCGQFHSQIRTYKVCRVQDAVLHRMGEVQGELPQSSLLAPLANWGSLRFHLLQSNSLE